MARRKISDEEIADIGDELEPDEIEHALSSLPSDESHISLYRMHEMKHKQTR